MVLRRCRNPPLWVAKVLEQEHSYRSTDLNSKPLSSSSLNSTKGPLLMLIRCIRCLGLGRAISPIFFTSLLLCLSAPRVPTRSLR